MLTATELVHLLKSRWYGSIHHVEEKQEGKVFVTIESDKLVSLVDSVVNQLGFRFIVNVGSDEVTLNGHYIISYIFSHDRAKLFLSVRVPVDPENPFIDSIANVVAGANWAEREVRDMIGVHPKNHPDPRRLVLADDWPEGIYPLRKDVRHDLKPPSFPENRQKLASPPEGARTVPIGPFFPVLEEPAFFKVFVEGEKVVGSDYRGFYSHRGIEKMGDDALTYNQICFIAERICGICGFVHSSCYCQAVEGAAEIIVPERAQYIRTIMLELERLHSHLLWLGIAFHVVGYDTLLMQTWRVRESVMWICEEISGNRKTYGMNLVGGVRRDISEAQIPSLFQMIEKLEKDCRGLYDAVAEDRSLHVRLRNVGVIPEQEAFDICVVGPVARGSGIAIDSRKDHPYAAYPKLQFNVPVQEEGACWDRTVVRVEEIFQAIGIIRQALENMPVGSIMADFVDIPPDREGLSVVEAPRGEAIHYVLTGSENRPYRWKVRAPTYPNLQVVPGMIMGEEIADVPIAIASLDPCFSCTERMIVVDPERRENILSGKDLLEKSRLKTKKIQESMRR